MNTTLNATFNCDQYQTVGDIFDEPAVNYTALLFACPDKCAVLIGTGNPDLMGIGVLTSYFIQSILAFILGPPVYICYLFLEPSHRSSLLSIMHRFLATSCLYTSAVYTGILLRIAGWLNVLESVFIASLALYQLVYLLSVLSTWLTLEMNVEPPRRFSTFLGGIASAMGDRCLQKTWSEYRRGKRLTRIWDSAQESFFFTFPILCICVTVFVIVSAVSRHQTFNYLAYTDYKDPCPRYEAGFSNLSLGYTFLALSVIGVAIATLNVRLPRCIGAIRLFGVLGLCISHIQSLVHPQHREDCRPGWVRRRRMGIWPSPSSLYLDPSSLGYCGLDTDDY
ncbi:hypothetical protein F4778DRAFT_731388 [Xylariomycetidae sp. FL2044]|nr:hypothetical protein F4778DRAFT_731388 [Xylariomycetidae sp. FL2044]